MELYDLSLHSAAEGIRTKKFSALELFESCLARAVACDKNVCALITTTAEAGREMARGVDVQVARGEDLAPLAGVPVVLKDNICTKGVRTTAGSAILGNWHPPYDATVWALLREAGAVLLGKSNMDEFGMGNTCGNSAFGPTRNPWNITRVSGGSSGGSAAAVAAGYSPFAIGTDTGGSIRQPASFCGIYGLKPTYGMVSRYGVVAYGSSLDQVGPFARTVEDLCCVMSVLARHDPRDSSSVRGKTPHFSPRPADLRGKRVGLVRDFEGFSLDRPIADAMARVSGLLKEAGAEIVEVALPVVARYAVACYYAIAMSEAHTNLERYDGIRYGYTVDEADGIKDMFEQVRSHGFGSEVKSRIIAGTCLTDPVRSEEYYVAATKVRTLIAREFTTAFEGADFILQPVTPALPAHLGEERTDAMQGYESDLYTLPVNMAGLPGLSFFTGYAPLGLPVGLQLIGPRWSDAELLGAGLTLETLLGSPRIAQGGL